jgi:hypothetical protein
MKIKKANGNAKYEGHMSLTKTRKAMANVK